MSKKTSVAEGMAKSEQRRLLQQVKKQHKRNRDPRPPRCRDWANLDADDLEKATTCERVMPRDENDRRRMLEARLLEVRTATSAEPSVTEGQRGRVVAVSSSLCHVQLDGAVVVCAIRASLAAAESGYANVVAVGDWAFVNRTGPERGVVTGVSPRASELARPDSARFPLRQVVAANVDQLVVVASCLEPRFWPELVDRYLIAAERAGIRGVLCVNKIDLAPSRALIEGTIRPYRAVGYEVLLTSAETGAGIDDLRAALDGRLTVLAGLSGVGKSSLLLAVRPDLGLRTAAVSQARHEGRHTTSQAIMLSLDEDSLVIDTPGIREFGLLGLCQSDVIAFYPELAKLAASCRFADCTHVREAGCVVRQAVTDGRASAMRYDSFVKIRATLPP